MKVSCTKDSLLTGVNTVQRAVSNKSTLPILQGILIKAENHSLHFSATDLEIGISCEVSAMVESEGSIVLPARLFSEIVRKLPDTTIELEVDNLTVKIKYFQSDINLNSFDPEEFPLLPDLFDSEMYELPSLLFKNMIRQTVFACATEETRPVFTGILLNIEEGNIRLVSTDTHRLAYRTSHLENDKSIQFLGIIPAKTMAEIYRLLKDEDEILNVRFNESQVEFQFGSVRLLSRLIEGQFPNYKQVIPQNYETKVKLSVKNFLDAVERASLLSREAHSGNIVHLTVGNSLISIDQASEAGKISEQVEAEIEGKDVKISFNAKFILDVLKIIDTDDIELELSGSYSPGIIRPLDDMNYLYLVLPVRTS